MFAFTLRRCPPHPALKPVLCNLWYKFIISISFVDQVFESATQVLVMECFSWCLQMQSKRGTVIRFLDAGGTYISYQYLKGSQRKNMLWTCATCFTSIEYQLLQYRTATTVQLLQYRTATTATTVQNTSYGIDL